MSIQAQANAVCPKCGQTHTIHIYKSINTAENPELKARVRDGSLFLWECPHCGTVNLARYEVLYHDPERRLMFWMVPTGDFSQSQMAAITNHTKAMGEYRLRLVKDMGELMEKVLIDEAGLDDAVIELCKWVTLNELKQKDDNFSATLRFYRLEGNGEDRDIVFSFAKGDSMVGMKVGWNVYQDCEGILTRNPGILPGQGFIHIDADWVSSCIR
ncbi:MAG: CpXC domain-containing protein [Candidatus Cryptobacteroides sp.]